MLYSATKPWRNVTQTEEPNSAVLGQVQKDTIVEVDFTKHGSSEWVHLPTQSSWFTGN